MKSTVYFSRTKPEETVDSIIRKIKRLWEEASFNRLINKDDFVALKLHLGEEGGTNYIGPEFVRPVVALVKEKNGRPFLTETATLYAGLRSNAVDHLNLAYEHGFTFPNIGCPVIMADGLRGEYHVSVPLKKSLLKHAHLAGMVPLFDVLIGLAHPTGHLATCYGGALKNIGMGLASRGGKLAQHSGMLPQVITEKCAGCGVCQTHCPADAITINAEKMVINTLKCFGCGECFSVCPNQAIKISWGESSVNLQKKMVEYAAAAVKGKKCGFFNIARQVTKHCDCMGDEAGQPIIPDVGLLTSPDPVALDQATIDLINQQNDRDVFRESWPGFDYNIQLSHGEAIGLGMRTYQLKEIN